MFSQPSVSSIWRLVAVKIKAIHLGIKGDPAVNVFKNSAILASGIGISKILGFLAAPVLTRIYSPESFGLLAVFASTTIMLAPFGTLRYSVSIPLSPSDKVAHNLLIACLLILFSSSSILFCMIYFVPTSVVDLDSFIKLEKYKYLIVISFIGLGLSEVLSAWATRKKAFTILSVTNLWQTSSSVFVKTALGCLGIISSGLLIGHVVSQYAGNLYLIRKFIHKKTFKLKFVSPRLMIYALKRYIDFPKYRLPSQFLLSASSEAPLIFSALIFGANSAGQIGLALSSLSIPIALFSKATGDAYYAEIARIGTKDRQKVLIITKSVIRKLLILSLLPCLLIFSSGPTIFIYVFGEDWALAGDFARALSFSLVAQFATSPIMNVISVIGKERYFLIINLIRIMLVLSLFGISLITEMNEIATIWMYSLSVTLFRVVIYIKIKNLINV